MSLRLFFYCAMLSGYFHFGNNHFFLQFVLIEDILQMFAYSRNAYSKKLRHSFLCAPDCLILNDNLYFTIVIRKIV